MKVTTDAESQLIAGPVGEFSDCLPYAIAAVGVGIVRMGSRNYVGNAIRNRQATHLEGHIPGFRTVVNAGKKMGMDVNHEMTTSNGDQGRRPNMPIIAGWAAGNCWSTGG